MQKNQKKCQLAFTISFILTWVPPTGIPTITFTAEFSQYPASAYEQYIFRVLIT